jgi:predicted nucleotidyltransferase
MRRNKVIEVLSRHRDELTGRYGVRSLALFGSVARDDAAESSDIDILVDFGSRPMSLFQLGRLQQRLSEILAAPNLDLVVRESIIPDLRDSILGDSIEIIGPEVGVSH